MLRPWKLQIKIDLTSKKAIYLQIADAIIDAIKNEQLHKNQALPGSRQLAELIKVNRNTVVEGLNVLIAEGWLVSKERKGTFVANVFPKQDQHKSVYRQNTTDDKHSSKPLIVFDDGFPDSRLAPTTALARAYRQIFNRKARWQMMGYSNELGDSEFRNAMVQMLNFKRGMNTSIHEICITRGSQMAMYLTSHCLLEKNDFVLIENPGYKPAWRAFESIGANLLPVSIDDQGLSIDDVKYYLKKHKKIKALYTTPHHQFPTTVTMSLQRRLELISLSNQYGFTIIEDDYDNEFHFGYRPVLPISSFDNVQHFIYIGTLSKIIAPALRIGYLVGSQSFVKKAGDLRKIIDVQGDNIMEQAILQLIKDGEVKRHLKKTSAIYKAKRDYFETLLHTYLKEKVSFSKPDGGLAFWLVPKKEVDVFQIAKKLNMQGIDIITPNKFSFINPIHGFRLGYASLSEEHLKKGVIALSKLL